MEFKNLLYEAKELIAVVTINRPDKLNALNSQTMMELKELFTSIKNDELVKVVIITGSGEKAFVAGADIKELSALDVLSGKEFAEKGQDVFNLIENLGKPVIAAVNGFALGGGCELAMACHIRLVSDRAKFGQPEVNLGVIPGYGGTQRLARIINSGRALEYILTGDMIDADDAFRIGLANRVYPHDELMAKAWEMAVKITTKGQVAVQMAVEGQNLEASLFAVCCGSEDFKEGTKAFLEKRKPNFTNK
jgi:enoyl-CoA hydratase